jgi:hypothetical protein
MAEELEKQPFRIGDLVRVKAQVIFKYVYPTTYLPPNVTVIRSPESKALKKPKSLLRYPKNENTFGVVVGWTIRRTGLYSNYGMDDDFERGYLISEAIDYFKVWQIELLNSGQRFTKLISCIEEDLEVVKRYGN